MVRLYPHLGRATFHIILSEASPLCFQFIFSKNLLFAVLLLFYIHFSNAECVALRFSLFNVAVRFM